MIFGRHLSLIFILAGVCLDLSSCARQPSPALDDVPDSNYASARSIIDRCGKIETTSATAVIDFIQARLLSGFARRNAPRYPVKLTLAACTEPLAYSVGNGQVVFSQGLIKILPNEAELAFVIAHELAHDALHHQTTLLNSDHSESPSTVARTLELEADKLAIGIIALAGYDPRGAISALNLLSNPRFANTPIAGHPSTIERTQQLREAITDSGWQPPGIVNRRPYLRLRAQLEGQIVVESRSAKDG